MTKLSPAAQSIYNAAHAADAAPFSSLADIIAAALRAVAEPFDWTWNAEMCHKHLITIANELEAQ
jgi:hypothetical protein